MRSTAPFRLRDFVLAMAAFFALLASEPPCYAQVRARGGCSANPSAKTAAAEIESIVSCVDGEIRSAKGAIGVMEMEINTLRSEINTLKHVVAYGSVHEGLPLQLFKPIPCEKLGLDFIIDRPGLYTVNFDHPLRARPVVILTLLDNQNAGISDKTGWVSDVSEHGFRVETSSDGKVLNNIDFNFLVLSGDFNGDGCFANQ
jgi:hypothetical protein